MKFINMTNFLTALNIFWAIVIFVGIYPWFAVVNLGVAVYITNGIYKRTGRLLEVNE